MDPDKWEFASQWFLRDQKHLLKNITRRRHSRNSHIQVKREDDGELALEISKLKQEQIALETEVESMNKRIEATEKRPQQMMSFLYKIMENPEILQRILLQNRRVRRRVTMRPPPSPVKFVKAMEDDSSPETGVFDDNVALSSPETTLWWNGGGADSGGGFGDYIELSPPESNISVHELGDGRDSVLAELVAGGGSSSPPPYPFSLFSGGF